MNNQKLETELQLALGLTQSEREKSLDLDVGYFPELQEWELIVKYTGDLSEIAKELSAVITPLLNEYAIIRIREYQIQRLSEYPQIEFIEKPKSLVLEEMEGISASCINRVRLPPYSLTGKGIVIAVIDSGIAYAHPDFRREDGSTRILQIWDQSTPGNPPEPYQIGTVYTAEEINEALQAGSALQQQELVPEVDLSGHGTHVAGIAAGNGRASNGTYIGVAPEAELLIVKLAPASVRSFPRTSELMQGIDWAIRYGLQNQVPVVVNLSFGNNYGSHDGNSLLEQYISDVANLGRSVIIVGAGNEGNTGRHVQGRLERSTSGSIRSTNDVREIEFAVAPYERGMNLQIWKEYGDEFEVALRTPSGMILGPFGTQTQKHTTRIGSTNLVVYYGQPTPYSSRQEIYIAMIPVINYIEEGIWSLLLYPKYVRSGQYNIWLPVAGSTNARTEFLQPDVWLTVTIPSTANRVITVGAYNSRTDSYAAFSGRGELWNENKPDLVAPGVNITAAAPGGGYDTRSGTSMAAPFVAGGAALLMEWGIINGNDIYLYGEKVKAYLIRGARELPGFFAFPNPQVGWGALCVARSIPELIASMENRGLEKERSSQMNRIMI